MDKAIVKTRLGHYWTPGSGVQTALVVDVNRGNETVNLSVWQEDGECMRRLNVPITPVEVSVTDSVIPSKATFHLAGSCIPACPEYGR